MNIFFISLVAIIALAVIMVGGIFFFGYKDTPMWILYASYPVMALGGGAANYLILFGIPK